MKKKNILLICIIIVVILSVLSFIANYIDKGRVSTGHEPKLTIKIVSEDGKKVTYWGLGYKVVRYPSVSPNEPYKNNRGVKMGNWFMKYELPEELPYAKDLKKEDIIGESEFLFSINWGDNKTDCIPIQLDVFDNGTYTLYTSYEACPPSSTCNSMLKYSEAVKGTYNYDAMKIIHNSIIADDIRFTNDNLPEFEIYPGNQAKVYHLMTDSKNPYLDEFLKQIDVNLKKCAEPDYK